MTTPHESFVRLDGEPGCLWNTVTIGTPVVFLHGFGDSAECWFGLVDRLELPNPVYLLDAPGHAGSKVDLNRDFATQLAARAVAFLERLAQPAVLVGHSMGALQAMYAAGDAPELVRGMVLEDPPLAQDLTPWQEPTIVDGLSNFITSMHTHGLDASVARARTDKPGWDEVEYEPWVRSKLRVDPDIRRVFRIHREAMEETLARIHCPSLLMTADEKLGAIITPEAAMWAASQNPFIRVTRWSDAGHDIRRDIRGPYAAAVRSFIEELA